MPLSAQIAILVAGLLVVAVGAEAWIKRNRPKRSLVEKFKPNHEDEDENKPELGMEATDMNSILISERGNRSAASLGARDFGFWNTEAKRKRRPKTDAPKPQPQTPQKEKSND